MDMGDKKPSTSKHSSHLNEERHLIMWGDNMCEWACVGVWMSSGQAAYIEYILCFNQQIKT